MAQPKIFVLDTNIPLHDYKSIRHFQDNDLVIPIAVIEELDKFKKGNDTLSFNARGFLRELDKITDGRLFGKDGVPIGPKLGNIKIEPNHPFPDHLKNLFLDDIQDHRILATAIWVRDQHPGRFTALVTKDINLRMKAKAAGMAVQDYLTDRVQDDHVEVAQKEVEVLDNIPADVLQSLAYGPDTAIDWKRIANKEPKPNQLYKFRWEAKSDEGLICARYDARRKQVVLVKNRQAYGIRPRNEEQRFALDACLNPDIQLVSLTGGAGTGKTLLALAAALEVEKDFDQIILTRPTIILGNQDIGFLPGDQKSKMSPFIQPMLDNINVIKGETPHFSAGLYPRPQPGEGVLHRGRGPEPHAARGQNHYHPCRGRHQDGLYGRYFPNRFPLSGPVVERPDPSGRKDEWTETLPTYLPPERRKKRIVRNRIEIIIIFY